MQHRILRITSIVFGIITLANIGFYNYLVITDKNHAIRWAVKIFPPAIYMIFAMLYILIYRVTIYSTFTLGLIFIETVGDLFIEIYDSPFLEFIDKPKLYVVLGGLCYFAARIMLTFLMALKPYDKFSLVYHEKRKMVLSHVLFTLPYVGLAIMFLVMKFSIVSVFISIFLTLGFGLAHSYSFIRIGSVITFKLEESALASVLGFVATTLYNISHLLIISMLYNKSIPWFMRLISTNIYWVSMGLLTLSIIRCSKEDTERGYFTVPLIYDLN